MTNPAYQLELLKKNPRKNPHYTQGLQEADPEAWDIISREYERARNHVALIASVNDESEAASQAAHLSRMTNLYSEGYPGKRFYEGNKEADAMETLAIERAKKLFGAGYANVQPNSGSQANQAVLMALLQPGDTFMGLSLDGGGHLTHGAKPNLSGVKYGMFNAVQYGLGADNQLDYEAIAAQARQAKPKVIIAGGSAYSRAINFRKFREIADETGAYLMVDMAHFAGLVAGDAYKPKELKNGEQWSDFNPIEHAHVVTSTTHKTLRGPRHGLILAKDGDIKVMTSTLNKTGGKEVKETKLSTAIDGAVFPGLQGGPHMHIIAAKAVAFGEMLAKGKDYAKQVVDNAQALAGSLNEEGLQIVSGGTDTHLVLIDLRNKKLAGGEAHISGRDVAASLDRAGLTANKNAVPNDPKPPVETSGVRMGTAAGTTRGLGTEEFRQIGKWTAQIVNAVAEGKTGADLAAMEEKVRGEVQEMLGHYPIYNAPASHVEASAGRRDSSAAR